ncbi:MotA/TolQ/ExbB proton channel family protein [Devosia sp. A449]
MESVISIGLFVRAFVLDIAGWLREESAPGLVSLALVVLLTIAIALFLYRVGSKRRALARLRTAVRKYKDGIDLSRNISELDSRIKSFGRRGSAKSVAEHWTEFRETLVPYEVGENEFVLRNAARPSIFFNVADLGFGAGFWRIVPGLFVTAGLFFTFLGLVAALQGLSVINADSMSKLMNVASAKFIMSLTGLFCSIIFTIVLRIGMSRLEDAAHTVSSSLEQRLSFISLESLAVEQLAAVREQREHFRTIGMELVAELGRPLREDIPLAISSSITAAMAPLLDQVGKAGTDGVGTMVQDLSSRFSDDVGKALSQASDKLAQAGERISQLSERMDQSSGRMGGEMDSAIARVAQAVDDLRSTMTAAADATGGAFSQGADRMLSIMNETLQGIRENTGEGARAMSAAAGDLRLAGEAFKEQMEGASKAGSEAARERIEASGSEIARLTGELTSRASEELLAPLGEIARQLDGVAGQVAGASADMRQLSEGVRSGAEASVQAASNFRSASGELVSAATPIRALTERIEGSIRQLAEATQHVSVTVSRSAEATASSALEALNAAKQILGTEARAIEAGLEGVAAMLERLKGQGDRLDDMDSKLGQAFEIYTTQVASAVDSMRGHVSELQGRLSPALDTLQAVVDQAEQFAPQSRRP